MTNETASECCLNSTNLPWIGSVNISNETFLIEQPLQEKSGYDLPVMGMEQGTFEIIHGTAIGCLVTSLLCAITTILLTAGGAHKWRVRNFYSWSTGDRMLIYMALMDGTFNIVHMMDHGMYWWQRDHVRPFQVCNLFGFMLSVFVIAQNVLVCYVAFRACVMVFRMRAPDFGYCDWQPISLSFIPGITMSVIIWGLDKLGPSGAFCYLDPVKAPFLLMSTTTGFLVLIGVTNMVLYTVTVWRLWVTDRRNRHDLGSKNTQLGQSVNKTAWTCTYFIVSFFVQWLPMMVYGTWAVASAAPPFSLFMAVTTFTNLGGLFNLLLFVYVRWKKRRAQLLSRQNAVRGRRTQRRPGGDRSTSYMTMPPPSSSVTLPTPHGNARLHRFDHETIESDTLISCTNSASTKNGGGV